MRALKERRVNVEGRGGGGKRHGDATPPEWAELEAQVHELEVLLEETEVPPPLLSAYWELSADLIALLEELNMLLPAVRAGLLDPRTTRERYASTRQRLIALQARAQEISLDVDTLDTTDGW
jgi:hypothetical protein